MSTRSLLLAELLEVKSALAALSERVADIEAQLASLDEFEVVDSTPAHFPEAGGSTAAQRGTTSGGSSQIPSDQVREDAARETGRFFARCLRGEPRGDSGRSRVKLQARHYVVVRSFAGEVFTAPVRVYSTFSEVRALVAEGGRGHQFGDSIFAGFAALWEARLAVQEAGFTWPPSSN